jgi:cellulose synthase/poly-beta-1,6-N-acetylglucosamine synthase-like glycosyltransferase
VNAVEVLMWAAIAVIVYAYAGYPLALIALASARGAARRAAPPVSAQRSAPPSIAVLVAAHDEERHIAARIRNLLEVDYPADRLRVLIGSDGSGDGTVAIVRGFDDPRIVLLDSPLRRGKPAVLNQLAGMATEEILVLTDANTLFARDTLRQLAAHFDDPTVGCVCGELRLTTGAGAENPDGVYWRYERMLKAHEARIDALQGANGGVYALRRERFRPVPANTIVDDFWISMEVVSAGFRCVYEPRAVATEEVPPRIRDEFRRRVRIGIGNYQALVRFAPLMHPRHGLRAFAFVSHKVLRWFVPHLMVVALLANVALVGQPPYGAMLALQLAFYGLSALAWWRSLSGSAPRLLRLPLFFVGMNLALLVGFWKFLTGQYSGAWARTER